MRRALSLLVVCGLLPWSTEFAAVPKEAPSRPRVLILGDSISIGYGPLVEEALRDVAFVTRPKTAQGKAENCAGTTNALVHLDRWLAAEGGKWDVIHFNFGLHDLKRVVPSSGAGSNDPSHPRQAEPEKYKEQLEKIVEKLERTGARLIFATTTPVPPGGVRPHRDVEDPARYNRIALEVLKGKDIAVNDLYSFSQKRLKEIQRPVNVHFTEEGSRLLAEQAVKAIRKALRPRPSPRDEPK